METYNDYDIGYSYGDDTTMEQLENIYREQSSHNYRRDDQKKICDNISNFLVSQFHHKPYIAFPNNDVLYRYYEGLRKGEVVLPSLDFRETEFFDTYLKIDECTRILLDKNIEITMVSENDKIGYRINNVYQKPTYYILYNKYRDLEDKSNIELLRLIPTHGTKGKILSIIELKDMLFNILPQLYSFQYEYSDAVDKNYFTYHLNNLEEMTNGLNKSVIIAYNKGDIDLNAITTPIFNYIVHFNSYIDILFSKQSVCNKEAIDKTLRELLEEGKNIKADIIEQYLDEFVKQLDKINTYLDGLLKYIKI